MKLVHVLPFEIFLGGGERFIKNWMLNSVHESLMYARAGNQPKLVEIQNCTLYRSDNELLQMLNQHRNDIIVWHSFPEGAIKQVKGFSRVIWYVHGAYAFKKDVALYPKPFMCVSNYRPAVKHPSWSNIFVAGIPLGIDLNQYGIGERENSNGKIKVGIVGRVSPEKLPKQFFQELVKFNLTPAASKFEFVHFGAGVNDQFHKEYLQTISKIPNYTYAGSYPHERSHEMYHEFDLMMVPSITETGSYAIVEAQASGLKVYALRRDGIPSHVTSQSKLFTNYADMFLSLSNETVDGLNELKPEISKESEQRFDVRQQVARLDFIVTV